MIETLKKYIATILHCLGIEISNNALFHLTSVVVDFINQFFTSLLSITEQQRRFQPGYIDLLILLKGFNIDPSSLLYQLDLSKIIQESTIGKKVLPKLQQSLELQLANIDSPTELDDVIYEKTRQYDESSRLLPPSNKRKFYIQNYLPEFPPDHTYKNSTANERNMENPKKLRQILVHEGNQALQSLLKLQIKKDDDRNISIDDTEANETRSLISPPLSDTEQHNASEQVVDFHIEEHPDDNISINKDENQQINSLESKIENKENKSAEVTSIKNSQSEKNKKIMNDGSQVIDISENRETVEDPFPKICSNLPTKPLDIVQYANSRLSMLRKRNDKIVNGINKLRSDKTFVNYLIIRKHLSSYKSYVLDSSPIGVEDLTNREKPPEINFPINYQVGKMIKDSLSNEYDLLVRNLKIEDRQRVKRIKRKIELKKEKQALELQKQQEEMKAKRKDQDANAINIEIDDGDLDEFDNFDFDFDATTTTSTSNTHINDSSSHENKAGFEKAAPATNSSEKPSEPKDVILKETADKHFKDSSVSTAENKYENLQMHTKDHFESTKQKHNDSVPDIKTNDNDIIDIDIGGHALDSDDDDDDDLDALLEDV